MLKPFNRNSDTYSPHRAKSVEYSAVSDQIWILHVLRRPIFKGHPQLVQKIRLRNDGSIQTQRLTVLHHQLRSCIVVLADVFKQFDVGRPPEIKTAAPRLRVDGRVIYRHFVLDSVEVRTREALESMQPFGMRQPRPVDPEVLTESDGIDNQRVPFPMT